MELHSVFRDVVAYVEVRTGNDNRSAAIAQELKYLGARVEPTFTDVVTHVVFKEGLKRTWNKAMKKKVHLVSVSWIDSCKQNQTQMPEKEFTAVKPEEISSPLPRINQPVRWKKMKSMQPCDFDEELARSAERGEKKRRKIMWNKFVLNEEMTPTTSSPVPVLAFETQARSPIPSAFTRVNTPIPDTPPSMQERLERMRREQKQVLDLNLDRSPPSTPKAPIDSLFQRRLYDLFTVDIISTGSSNEQDEAASKTITDIIRGLDSNSEYGSQPSEEKKGITLASDKSEKDSCMLKSSIPETPNADPVSSCPSSNATLETSHSSNTVTVRSDRKATRMSRRSCVQNTSNSILSLDQNISNNSQNRSVKKSENKSRRSEPLGGRYSKSRRTSLNALSPKDLNINTPPLDGKSSDLQQGLGEVNHHKKPNTLKISDGCFRAGRQLLEAVTEADSDNCEKAATAEGINNMESNRASIGAQVGQQKTKRLSKRQSLIPEKSNSLSLISKELKPQSTISSEKAKVGLSSGFEPEKGCMSTRESLVEPEKGCISTREGLVEPDKQSNKTTNSNSFKLQGSTDSTSLKAPRKKRNLFAGTTSTAFPLCSLEASSKQKSPDTVSSHKSKVPTVGSDIKSDISFMFGFQSRVTKADCKKIKRRSPRLDKKPPLASVSSHSQTDQDSLNCSSKNKLTDDNSLCKSAIKGSSLSSHVQQNQSSFGDSILKGEMSMSMAYGHDSSLANVTRACPSRRSLEEFRTNIKTTGREGKPNRLSTMKPKPAKTSKHAQKTNESKNKLTKQNRNTQPNKTMKRTLSASGSSINMASAKRHKTCDPLPHVDGTLSESSCAEDEQVPARLRHAHSLLMEQKRQPSSKRSFCSLVVTSLHRDEQETVYAVVKSLGVFHLTNNVEPTTTHVICGESRRTLNLLKGIASGCWLLRKEWVLESLEAGTWLQEESYEMRDIPAAVKSRCERQKIGPSYKLDLFSKCGPMFVSSVCTPPRTEIVHLIHLCCGQVTGSETRAAIHLGDEHNPKKLVIKPSWVLDCIMNLETLPTDDHIVFPKTLPTDRESSPEF